MKERIQSDKLFIISSRKLLNDMLLSDNVSDCDISPAVYDVFRNSEGAGKLESLSLA